MMKKIAKFLKKIARIVIRNEKMYHKLVVAYGAFWGWIGKLYEKKKIRYFKLIKKLCKVKKVDGYQLIRVGGKNDGGYIMLDDFDDSKIAYSFGIGQNITWDEFMADKGIDVYCYDHTIDCLPKENDRLHFNKIGISGIDKSEEKLLSMSSILHRNCHDGVRNIILKMDVEGAEWDFFESVSSDLLNCFSQMTFELHAMTYRTKRKTIAVLKKINKTHQAIWIHANNYGGVDNAGNISIPDLLEITYVNRNQYKFIPTVYNCPLDIDEPNRKGEPDIVLKDW